MNKSDQSTMRFRCPHCSVVLRGKTGDGGKPHRCPKCEQPFRVPKPKGDASRKQTAAPKTATKKKEKQLIPVVCGVCATRVYADTSQLGSLIECPDCFTQNLVKPPPKSAAKAAPRMDESMNYDIEPEQQIEITSDLGRDLLEEADRKVVEEIESAPRFPNKPFVSGVYTYPCYQQVFPLIITMTLSWTLVVVAIRFAFVLPFMIPVAAILGILIILPSIVSFQKMFENTSIADDEAECRPRSGVFGLVEWAFDAIPIALAVFLSALPAAIPVLSMKLNLEYLALIPVSVYVFFPFIFMSMLESASVAGIVSRAVIQSLAKMPGTWFKFYFSTGILFALAGGVISGFAYWRSSLEFPPAATTSIGALAATCAGVAILLTIYFRLLGRVALVLSHELEIEEVSSEPTPSSEAASTAESEVSLGV